MQGYHMKKETNKEKTEPKVHKVPWQEKYASPAEIKQFLSDHIYLRYNTVKYRVEARLPSEDAFCQNGELAQFASDDWQPMSDRPKNNTCQSNVLKLAKNSIEYLMSI